MIQPNLNKDYSIDNFSLEDNSNYNCPDTFVLDNSSFEAIDLEYLKILYKSPSLSLSNLSNPNSFVHDFANNRIFQFNDKELNIVVDNSILPISIEGYLVATAELIPINFEMGEYYLSKKDCTFRSSIPSKMSFDTVRFGIPVTSIQLDIFKCVFAVSHLSSNYNVNQDIEYGFEKFQFITFDEMGKLPSNTKSVNFSYVNPTHPTLPGHIILELSIPKQFYGHNSLMFWQLDTFFERFRNYLVSCLNFDLIHWSEWILKRVDVCYNFNLSSFDNVKNTLSYLSSLRMRNRPSRRNNDGNIPYWVFQSNTIKFYSKYQEMLKHKDSFDKLKYDVVLDNSRNILRFEHEWRSKYLLKKLNLHHVNMITVGRFLDYLLKDYNYITHLKSVLGEFSMNDKKVSLKDIRNSIKSNFREYNVYLDLIDDIIDNGLDKVKSNLSRSQYYHKVKKLKDIGIDVSVINEHFHEHSEITEPDKNFINSNLTNLTDEEAMFIDSIFPIPDNSTKLQDFLKQQGFRITHFDGKLTSLPSGYEVQTYK